LAVSFRPITFCRYNSSEANSLRTMAEPIYAGMQSTDIMYYLLPPVVNCPVYVLLQTVYRRDTALKCGLAEAGKDRLAGRILGIGRVSLGRVRF